MNSLTIIGNLCKDPESRVTRDGVSVTSFTVAVNRRRNSQSANSSQPEADFFYVSAWRQLGENCAKYLAKGRRVCVIGPVSCRTYTGNDGTTRASMEINAIDVEFLSTKTEDEHAAASRAAAPVPAPAAAIPANTVPAAPAAPAYQAKQTTLQHPGNADAEEQTYVMREREAIQNEHKYVVVDPDDQLPF